jgi:hypothetical protein
MTERYGYGYRDEPGGGERPSGRGAVAERRAGQEEVREVDLTDEAADREQADAGQLPSDEREASGAFEPHPVGAAPAASTSIFDVGREEETAASGPPEAAADEAEREAAEAEAEAADQGEAEAAEREAAAEAERERAEVEAADRGETEAAGPEAAAEAERDEAERERAEAEATEPEAVEPGVAEAQAAEEPAAPATATPEPAAPAAAAAPPEALLGSLDAEGARNRFLDIQAGFVDEPRQAVEEAGRFVDELVQRVTDALQAQRSQLQQAGDDASTEDLRLTLRAYRQFVDRLLGLAR